MRVLITGACGFSARHLIKLIAAEPGYQLYLTDRDSGGYENILNCDLRKELQIEELIFKIRPERIYNLAGSYTNNYDLDYSVNVLGTKNILDALLKLKIACRVLLIGSAAEYGFINVRDNPINEDYPLQPARIHGLTKAYQTYLMNFYCKVYQMDLVMARTFNLFGGSKQISKLLFVGKIYEQIEKVKRRELSKISVGNLEAKRDYIDIREAVKYYQKIMEQGSSGQVYNVGSGKSVKMRELLGSVLKEAGLNMNVVEEKGPKVSDKTDISEIYADLRKIKSLGEKYVK